MLLRSMRLYTGLFGVSKPVVFEGDFSDELIAGVKKLGLDIEAITQMSQLAGNRGYVVGVAIDANGRRKAVNSSYVYGMALGY